MGLEGNATVRGRRRALSVLAVLLGLFGIGTGAGRDALGLKTFEFRPSSFKPGGHPDSEINFAVTSGSAETLKSVTLVPTAGFAVEPSSIPTCSNRSFLMNECEPTAQVGIATVRGEYEGSSEFLFGHRARVRAQPPPEPVCASRFHDPDRRIASRPWRDGPCLAGKPDRTPLPAASRLQRTTPEPAARGHQISPRCGYSAGSCTRR